jgi:phage-related protein
MRGFRGDFLGFTFNNTHSSALGITRVLNGNMDIPLTTNQNDIATEVSGRDGKYYYGTTYQEKTIVINFAFEDLSDEQINIIKTLWNDKQVHPLILDEYPYKVYFAKASGSSVIKHLSFSRPSGTGSTRYYSGEGSFTFVCFFPYAISRFSYLEEYIMSTIPEWIEDQ